MNSKSCNNLSKCFLSHNFKFITCVVYCDLQSLLIDFYVSKDEMHVSMYVPDTYMYFCFWKKYGLKAN